MRNQRCAKCGMTIICRTDTKKYPIEDVDFCFACLIKQVLQELKK